MGLRTCQAPFAVSAIKDQNSARLFTYSVGIGSVYVNLRCPICQRNTWDYIPDVPRPKLERPDPIPWPDLNLGQSERLRRTRAQRGFSLRHLAALSGVSPATIRAIESGGKGAPRSDVLAALAGATASD